MEAYTLHVCVATWNHVLQQVDGGLTFMSCALGVLHDAFKLRAKDATLNALLADTALIMAPLGLQVNGVHPWSQRNATCDSLSRLRENESIPERLRQATKTNVKRPAFKILGCE